MPGCEPIILRGSRGTPTRIYQAAQPEPATLQGRLLLVQHRDIADPDHGGRYTVKVYESVKAPDGEGGWRHAAIRLKPDTDAPGYGPIVLEGVEEGALQVIAELVEVLGWGS